MVTLDQVERLFTSIDGQRYRENLFDELRKCLEARSSRFRLVVCIRSGFDDAVVEVEQRLGQVIPPNARFEVTRFVPERAATLLKTMADHDATPFSAQLRSAIVGDLVRDGTVCPAELQAVSNWSRDGRIRTLAGYERVGRAQGLFWRHVNTIVAPIDTSTSVGPASDILKGTHATWPTWEGDLFARKPLRESYRGAR